MNDNDAPWMQYYIIFLLKNTADFDKKYKKASQTNCAKIIQWN